MHQAQSVAREGVYKGKPESHIDMRYGVKKFIHLGHPINYLRTNPNYAGRDGVYNGKPKLRIEKM
jgi:hypothetical protein